jgi:hypothetical protein
MTDTLLSKRIAALAALLVLLYPAPGRAQFETPNTAGVAGGTCTTGHYAFPDSNGYTLKCVAGVWVIPAGSSGTVSLGSQYQMAYYAANGTVVSGDYRIVTDSSNNLNIGTSAATAGALKIGGVNGISFPSDTSTLGNSIAIGPSALAGQTVSGAYGNIGIGWQVLSTAMTTGAVANTAVGTQALASDTSGSSNAAFGNHALNANTTGVNNVGIGSFALAVNTTGGLNTAVGVQALNANTSGFVNTAVGNLALGQNTTGGQNTAIGALALGTSTTGNNNSVFGYQVASTTLNTGSNNILIGTNSAVDTPLSGTSNFLNIGNLIYGTSIGTAAAPGNVGIGTATPLYTLDVLSTATRAINVTNSNNSTNSAAVFGSATGSSGAVIGVYGQASNTSSFSGAGVFGSGGNNAVGVQGSGTNGQGIYGTSIGNEAAFFQSISTSNTSPTLVTQQYSTSTADLFQAQNASGVSLVKITSSGSVGIGTTNPLAQLQVGTLSTNWTELGVSSNYPIEAGYNNDTRFILSDNAYTDFGSSYSSSSSGYPGIMLGHGLVKNYIVGDANGLLLQPVAGNVGIGTTNATASLIVVAGSAPTYTPFAGTRAIFAGGVGTGDHTDVVISAGSAGVAELDLGSYGTEYRGGIGYDNSASLTKVTNNGSGIVIDTNGKVGIGTSTVRSLLDVNAGEVQIGSSGASCASINAGAIRYSSGTLLLQWLGLDGISRQCWLRHSGASGLLSKHRQHCDWYKYAQYC